MINDIRDRLNKATSELIESFVSFDKNKAMHLKIGLHALHNAQKEKQEKINLYAVCDYDILNKLLEEHGITQNDFSKVPDLIDKKTNAPEKFNQLPKALQEAVYEVILSTTTQLSEVPPPGMVAVMFNLVDNRVKNALIAGQAGERTLKAIERALASKIMIPYIKGRALVGSLYDYGDKNKLARPYIGYFANEPDFLVSAQATNHLADLIEDSIKLSPDIKNDEDVKNSLKILKKLVHFIFKNTADNLTKSKADEAASQISTLAEHVDIKDINLSSSTQATDSIAKAMQKIRQALHDKNIITKEESADYNRLVEKRLEQVKKMEV